MRVAGSGSAAAGLDPWLKRTNAAEEKPPVCDGRRHAAQTGPRLEPAGAGSGGWNTLMHRPAKEFPSQSGERREGEECCDWLAPVSVRETELSSASQDSAVGVTRRSGVAGPWRFLFKAC